MLRCRIAGVLLAAGLVAALSVHAGPTVMSRASSPTPEVAGGGRDWSNAESDVVVQWTARVADGRLKTCSGVFVTPMAVLTARHCINGNDDPAGPSPPIVFPITISVGDSGTPITRYTSSRAVTWAAGPQTYDNAGNDIAIVFLDSTGATAGPALGYLQIVHPTFTSPCPVQGCGDANGGQYDPLLGMSGWAPTPPTFTRQLALDRDFNHFPGKPDDRGQYWRHPQGSIHLDHGDSGGPLFVRRPHPQEPGLFFRDVIGIAASSSSGSLFTDYDYWVDITRGAIAEWVKNNLADPLPRGPVWRARHPNLIFVGDVDYTGSCKQSIDSDCDHILDVHDNCPGLFNPDQLDTLDDGVGDACRNLPPNPPPPTVNDVPKNCLVSAKGCGSQVNMLCESDIREVPLDVRIVSDQSSTPLFLPVARVNPQSVGGYFNFVDPQSVNTATYQLCLHTSPPGSVCGSSSYTLQFLPPYHETCDSGSGGGGGSSGGGGPPVTCHPHCPQNPIWHATEPAKNKTPPPNPKQQH